MTKVKRNARGEIERLKSRLCGRGDQQQYGVEYGDTAADVVKQTTLRTTLAILHQRGWIIEQMDVVAAYLNSKLKENIHMRQPRGREPRLGANGRPMLMKLNKAIYGLKQAGREWMINLNTYLINELGFKQCTSDPCIFITNNVVLAVYVDDIVIGAATKSDADNFKETISGKFKMKALGPLKYILGIKVDLNLHGDLVMSQGAYVRQIIQRFNMETLKMADTPAIIGKVLCKAATEHKGDFPYREAIGALLYASVCTRPDITNAVAKVARYVACYDESHIEAVQRIFAYLKKYPDIGIKLPGPFNTTGGLTKLSCYVDSDYAGDLDERRSTSGYIIMYGNAPISWSSRKQRSTALSTAEAEYIALAMAAKELLWLRTLATELKVDVNDAIELYEDNQSCIAMANSVSVTERTKHIDVRHHFVRQLIQDGVITLTYCPTSNMIADILTKALAKNLFTTHRDQGIEMVTLDQEYTMPRADASCNLAHCTIRQLTVGRICSTAMANRIELQKQKDIAKAIFNSITMDIGILLQQINQEYGSDDPTIQQDYSANLNQLCAKLEQLVQRISKHIPLYARIASRMYAKPIEEDVEYDRSISINDESSFIVTDDNDDSNDSSHESLSDHHQDHH